jgi:glycosyltransferase involved in cell wall biosynthesis
MHVLQLTDFYRPTIGGLERHVETLSKEMVALGHRSTVVTLKIGDRPDFEVIDGVRVHRISGWSSALAPFYADTARPFHPTVPDPGLMRRLRHLVEQERPDIVHSHSWIQYSYFPLHRRADGPRHAVTLHDYGLSCAKKTYQQGEQTCTGPAVGKCLACARPQYGTAKAAALVTGLRASRGLLTRADAYIAISRAVADSARTVLPADADLNVIPSMVPNGMDLLAEHAERPSFLPASDGYLLFVGSLGRHKGVDVLLEAHRRMVHRVPLVLIGAPTSDTFDFTDPDVTVVHNQPSAVVMAAWAHASIGVVPSAWEEPLGQVAVEAMLAGRPVVASDVGGLKDIVDHGTSGLLVPPRDPNALAKALDTLLDSPERRNAMGRAGRDRARTFEVGSVAPRIIDLFDRLLQTGPRCRILDYVPSSGEPREVGNGLRDLPLWPSEQRTRALPPR